MKTVLITGASRGIGRETAKRFAEKGYNVAINYNESESAAIGLCAEIKSMKGNAEIFKADISDPVQVEKMVRAVTDLYGKIDILVNNAGIAPKQGLFTDFSDVEMRKVFDINVFGMMNCARAVAPQMIRARSGRIVNLSSIWGICGGSCEVLYSSAKAAVIGFTKALSKELAPSGINVNCVAPGLIDTDMNAHLSQTDLDLFCEDIPLGRVGKVSDVAECILFLASDSASYITGQVVTVDGGFI